MFRFILFVSTLLTSLSSWSTKAEREIAALVFFTELRKEVVELCKAGSPLRKCSTVSQEECVQKVRDAFDGCASTTQYIKVKESEVRSRAKELGKCTTIAYLKKSSINPTSECLAAVGEKDPKTNVKKSDHLSLLDRYKVQLVADMIKVENLKNSLKANRKEVCPLEKSKENSICFKSALKTFELTSIVQVPTLSVTAVELGLKDKELGHSSTVVDIMLIDNLITILERVELSKFHLSKYRAQNEKEKAELSVLLKDDESLINQTMVKLNSTISEKLSKTEKSREPSSVEAWKRQSLQSLKARHSKVQSRTWRYTP